MKWTLVLVAIVVSLLAVPFLLYQTREPEIFQVTVDELLADPTKYEGKTVNVTGHLQFVGVDRWTVVLPHYWIDEKGEMRVEVTLVEKTLFVFHLHETENDTSDYVLVIHETSGMYVPFFPLPFWFSPAVQRGPVFEGKIYERGSVVGCWKQVLLKDFNKVWVVET